ncbi:DUF421 domain-containing protein [Algoriphagus namhaensis]
MENLWMTSWENAFRISVLTILGYIAVVLIMRASGKRTLSKLNAYDFVLTVALGSVLATVALSEKVSLLDGVLCFSLFVLMQYLFTFLAVSSKKFSHFISSRPVMVFYRGEFLEKEMKNQRITRDEVVYACRAAGCVDLEGIEAVILESTGDLSVLEKRPSGAFNSISQLR